MKLITLMGADACGKDTQIAHLKKHLEAQSKKVQVITIWDSLKDFSEINDKKSLQEIVETFLLKYEAHARSFFLLSCLRNSFAKLDPQNDVVLLNGFFQKYWASEMSYGVESALWEKNVETFKPADQVFYLKTPVEQCLERKTHWSAYEQGLGQFCDNKKMVSKEIFQKNLHSHLDHVAKSINNLKIIDGGQSEVNVTAELIKHL